MRALFGCGTPRETVSAKNAVLFVIRTDIAMAIIIVADNDGKITMLAVVTAPEPD